MARRAVRGGWRFKLRPFSHNPAQHPPPSSRTLPPNVRKVQKLTTCPHPEATAELTLDEVRRTHDTPAPLGRGTVLIRDFRKLVNRPDATSQASAGRAGAVGRAKYFHRSHKAQTAPRLHIPPDLYCSNNHVDGCRASEPNSCFQAFWEPVPPQAQKGHTPCHTQVFECLRVYSGQDPRAYGEHVAHISKIWPGSEHGDFRESESILEFADNLAGQAWVPFAERSEGRPLHLVAANKEFARELLATLRTLEQIHLGHGLLHRRRVRPVESL